LDVSKLSGQAAIPSYFVFSFTSGTGGACRNYYIDNLEVCSVSFPAEKSDLVITDFSATPSSVNVGEEVTLTLSIKNYGPADTNDTITVTGLPKSSEWDIVEPVPSGYDAVNGTWTISTVLAELASQTLILKVKAKTPGIKTLTANALYPNEAESSDNQKTIQIEVINNAAFDAWEATLTKDTAKLYTKVVGTQFSVTVGTTNGSTFNGSICAAVVSNSGTVLSGGEYKCQDTNASSGSFGWSVTQAERNAKINIKFKYGAHEGNTTLGAAFTRSGYTDSNSLDSFAIRPASFAPNPSGLIAKNNEKLALTASPLSGVDGVLPISTRLISQALTCDKTTGFFENEPIDFTFTNGTSNEVTIPKVTDIGAIKVYNSSWTSVDSGDCIAGSGSNSLSADGKYGCDIEGDLTINPYKFVTTVDSITPSGKWQYISSSADQNITIKASVKAQNEDNVAVKNFDSSCAASNVDGKMSFASSVSGLQYSINNAAFTDLSGTEIPLSYAKEIFDNGEYKEMNITIKAKARDYSATQNPIVLKASKLNTSVASPVVNTEADVGDLTFLYGRIAMPSQMVDYASSATVRAYAQVYATSSSALPSGGNWVQAPGSSTWWINRLHDSSSGSIAAVLPRASSKLSDDNTTDTYAGITSSVVSNIFGGVGQIRLSMNNTANKDQKITLHFAVPEYLWYGSKAYSYDPNTDCSQHPCGTVDIFGTNDTTNADAKWFGSGDNKGDKTIKTVPKGKRVPKINW